ncbi:MAG: flavodoxin-dependent (E)-4-hydroxy-3-methylbut-2-enyl-diphosphate synthase [Flavonifractor plautii]
MSRGKRLSFTSWALPRPGTPAHGHPEICAWASAACWPWGIGDTMRVSLSADPVEESLRRPGHPARPLGLRKEGPELVSCPTCGRTRIDLIGLAAQVEERLIGRGQAHHRGGDGLCRQRAREASAADVGIAGGIGEGLLFRKGEIVKRSPRSRLVDELFRPDRGTVTGGAPPATDEHYQAACASCHRRSHFDICLRLVARWQELGGVLVARLSGHCGRG